MDANTLKKITRDAAKIREDSWHHPNKSEEYGEYAVCMYEACVRACKENDADIEFAYVLYLSLDSWWNDALAWAGSESYVTEDFPDGESKKPLPPDLDLEIPLG